MSKERVLFESEERQSLKQVAAFLRQLADKLDEQGEVTLRKGSNELTLSLPASVVLEVEVEEEVKKKRTKRELEIEIEWYEGEDEGTLEIS